MCILHHRSDGPRITPTHRKIRGFVRGERQGERVHPNESAQWKVAHTLKTTSVSKHWGLSKARKDLMKFAAVLRESGTELPDIEDLFRKYKLLKKSLKRLPISSGRASVRDESSDERNDDEETAKQDTACASTHGMLKDGARSDAQDPISDAEADAAKEAQWKRQLSALEEDFKKAIHADVQELNERYMEQEELAVMQCEALMEEVCNVARWTTCLCLVSFLLDYVMDLYSFF